MPGGGAGICPDAGGIRSSNMLGVPIPKFAPACSTLRCELRIEGH